MIYKSVLSLTQFSTTINMSPVNVDISRDICFIVCSLIFEKREIRENMYSTNNVMINSIMSIYLEETCVC